MAEYASSLLKGIQAGFTGVPTAKREADRMQQQQATRLGGLKLDEAELSIIEKQQNIAANIGVKNKTQLKAFATQVSGAYAAAKAGEPQQAVSSITRLRDVMKSHNLPTNAVDDILVGFQQGYDVGMQKLTSAYHGLGGAGAIEGYKSQDSVTDSAEMREFNMLTKGMSDEDIEKARRLKLNLDARPSVRLTPEQERDVAAAKTQGQETTKDAVALRSETMRQGLAAKTMIPKLEKLIELNQLISSGKTAPARKLMSNLFNLKGEDAANLGLFDAQSKQMVLGMIKQLGANPTEGERGFLLQITPSIEQGTVINEAILADLLEIQKRQYERGLKLRKNPGADPYELLYDDDWTPGYTASQGGSESAAPQAAIDMLMKNPSMKGAFKQKYGYLPEGM